MFKPNKAPVSKYSQLEASYNEYVEARSTLQRLDINLPSEVDSFLLQQLVQVLAVWFCWAMGHNLRAGNGKNMGRPAARIWNLRVGSSR